MWALILFFSITSADIYDDQHKEGGCCATGIIQDGYRAYREICSVADEKAKKFNEVRDKEIADTEI
jgi:hypothetical protein